MAENELKQCYVKIDGDCDAAIIYLMKDENIKSTVKGTLPDLFVLLGKIMADIDKEAQVND